MKAIDEFAKVCDQLAQTESCTAIERPISRRLFLSASAVAGALSFLGMETFGQTIIAAYADENGSLVFAIYVLSKEELPIIALDLSNLDKSRNPRPLQGVQVTIKGSQGGDIKLQKLTDKCGFVPLNVRSISFNKSSDSAAHYEAWGGIYAELRGYKIYEEDETYFISGMAPDKDNKLPNTVYVSMGKNDNKPYFSMASFDGLDILHTQRVARIAATNDYMHTLSVKLRNAGNTSWNFVLLSDGVPLAKVADVKAVNGVATAQFKGAWLNGKNGVKVNSKLAIGFVNAATGKQGQQVDLKASFVDSYGGALGKSNMSMMGNLHSDEDVKKSKGATTSWVGLPDFITRKDDMMLIGAPVVPVQFAIWPTGQMALLWQIGAGTMAWQGKGSKFSRAEGDFWKPLTPSAMWDSYEDTVKKSWQGYKDSLNPQTGRAISPITSALSISLNFTLQGIGTMTVTSDNPKIHNAKLDFSFETEFAAKAEFTLPFHIWIVPFYVGVDFSFSAAVRLMLGSRFKVEVTDSGPNKFSDFRFNAGNEEKQGQALAPFVKLNLEAGFSVAVGLKNVAALGIRAYGYVLMTFDFTAVDTPGHYPISVGTIAAKVQVFIQFLFFKKTFKVRDLAQKTLFDNRPNAAALASGGGLSADGVDYDDLQLVGEEELVREFVLPLVDWHNMEPTYELVEWTDRASSETIPNISVAGLYKISNADGENGFILCSEDEKYDPGVSYYRQIAASITALQVGRSSDVPIPESYELDIEDFNNATEASQLFVDPYGASNGSSYNPINGIKLAQVLPIREKAFSDARTQIACSISDDYDIPNYMFRIAAVELQPAAGEFVALKETAFDANANSEHTFSYLVSASDALKGNNLSLLAEGEKPVRSRIVYSVCKRYDKSKPGAVSWTEEKLLPLDEAVIDRTNRWDVDFEVLNSYGQHMFVAVVTSTRPQGGDKSLNEIFNNQYISLWVKDHGGLKPKGLNLTINCDELGPEATSQTMWNPRIAASIFHKETDPRPISAMDIDDVDFHTKVYFYSKKKDSDLGSTPVTLGYADFLISSIKGVLSKKFGTCALPSCFGEGAGKYRLEDGTFTVHQHQPICYKTGATLPDYKGTKGVRIIAWSCPTNGGKKATVVFWNEENPNSAIKVDNVSSFVKVPLRSITKDHQDDILFLYVVDETESESKLLYAITAEENGSLFQSDPILRTNFINMFCDPTGESLYIVRSMEGEAPHDKAALYEEGETLCYGAYGQYSSPQASLQADAIGAGALENVGSSDSDADSSDGADSVTLYQVLRADRRKKPKERSIRASSYFYDFYPYFQTDFPIDGLSYLAVDDEKHTKDAESLLRFFVTTTVDVDTNKEDPLEGNTAKLRMLKVPSTQGMQIDLADLNTTFCAHGQKVPLVITASNIGMRPIKSFSVEVKKKASQSGGADSTTVVFNDFAHMMEPPAEAYAKKIDEVTGKQLDEEGIDELIFPDNTTFYPGSTRKFTADLLLPIGEKEHGTIEFEVKLVSVVYGYGAEDIDPGDRYAAESTWESGVEESTSNATDFDPFTTYVNMVDRRVRTMAKTLYAEDEVVATSENFGDLYDIDEYSEEQLSEWTPIYPPNPDDPTEEEIRRMDAAAVAEVVAEIRAALYAGDTAKATSAKGGSFQLPVKISESGHRVRYEKLAGNARTTVSKSGLVSVKPGLKSSNTYVVSVNVTCGKACDVAKLKIKVSQ